MAHEESFPSDFEEFHEARFEQDAQELMLAESVAGCFSSYWFEGEDWRFRGAIRKDIARDWVNQVFCMTDMDGEFISDPITWERIESLERNFSDGAIGSRQELNDAVRYVAGADSGIRERNWILNGLHEAIEAGDEVIVDALVHMRVYAEQLASFGEELHPHDIIEAQFQKYRELAERYSSRQNNADDGL